MFPFLSVIVIKNDFLTNRRRSEFCRRYNRDNYVAKPYYPYGTPDPNSCEMPKYNKSKDIKKGLATLNFYR